MFSKVLFYWSCDFDISKMKLEGSFIPDLVLMIAEGLFSTN